MKWITEFKRSSPHYELLFNSTIYPLTGFDLHSKTFDGGIYTSDGQLYGPSIHLKNGYENVMPHKLQNATSETHLFGKYLFGGFLQNGHFGHFLVESLSRLWAVTRVKDIEAVLFVLRHPELKIAPFVNEILTILLGEVEVIYIKEITTVDRLVVPTQLAHPVTGYIQGHMSQRDLFTRLKRLDSQSPKNIYISRSRLASNEGRYIGEVHLEATLEKNGYFIVHPQKLSIEQQLRLYTNAEKLVFADGSSFHLFALVANPMQKVFIVWRRKNHHDYHHQLQSFTGKTPFGKPCLIGYYTEEDRPYSSVTHLAILNFQDLYEQLNDTGFLNTKEWSTPSQTDIEQEITNFSVRFKRSYKFVSTNENGEVF